MSLLSGFISRAGELVQEDIKSKEEAREKLAEEERAFKRQKQLLDIQQVFSSAESKKDRAARAEEAKKGREGAIALAGTQRKWRNEDEIAKENREHARLKEKLKGLRVTTGFKGTDEALELMIEKASTFLEADPATHRIKLKTKDYKAPTIFTYNTPNGEQSAYLSEGNVVVNVGTPKAEKPDIPALQEEADFLFNSFRHNPKGFGVEELNISQLNALAITLANSGEQFSVTPNGLLVDKLQELIASYKKDLPSAKNIPEDKPITGKHTTEIARLTAVSQNSSIPLNQRTAALQKIDELKEEQKLLEEREYRADLKAEERGHQEELQKERLEHQEELQKERLAQQKEMQTLEEEGRQQRHIDIRVSDASKRVAKLYEGPQGEALGALEILEREIEPYVYTDKEGHIKTRDIPGFGTLEGALPEWAYGVASELGLSPESEEWGEKGLQMRQVAQGLYNRILKIRSGAAITESELSRLKTEFGQGFGKPDQNFALGIRMYRAIHNRYVALNLATIMNQNVVKEIASRQGINLKLIDWARGFKQNIAQGKPAKKPQSYDDIMAASKENKWSPEATKEALRRWGY